MAKIYGKVEHLEDVRRINCIIRDEMLVVENEEQLTDLKKRSDYLCTLTYSPFWKKKFGDNLEKLREIAIEENRVSVRLANFVAKYKNFAKNYDAWGKDNEDIEKKLEELPKFVFEEIWDLAEKLGLTIDVLEDIRKTYCRIREAMILAKTEIQLTIYKKQSDVINAIVQTSQFKEKFEKVYDDILEIVEKEEKRIEKLSEILLLVNKDFYKENWVNKNMWNLDFEDYIEKILEEEKKSDTFISKK